jgi:hypothetical protein
MTENEKGKEKHFRRKNRSKSICGFSCGVGNRRKHVQSNKYRRKFLRKSCGLFSIGKSAGKARISSSA